MKLLHVITGLNVGGAETMLARIIEGMRFMPDIRQEIVTLMDPGPVGARIAAAGTPVHSLGMRGGVPSLRAAARLMSLARAIRPDLVMGWMHHGQIAASIAALAAPGRPATIWNVRHSLGGLHEEKPLTRLLLRAEAAMSRLPAAIVYNSRAAAREYRAFGFRPRDECVIPNGFDARGFRPRGEARRRIASSFGISGDRLLIGMVARNHAMKDVPSLVTAFARVAAHRADAHLLIAGEGMDAPSGAVAGLLATLPRASWTLAGHRSDVAEWLAGLDMLALPSAWGEGFPNIVGEAMACGVPCVATDVGDTAWVVGSTGLVVRPRAPDALAAALLDVAALGAESRAALGRAARARVEENFALATIVDRYAALFREYGGASSRRAVGERTVAATDGAR